jgi:Bacteriophage minor capsid protein
MTAPVIAQPDLEAHVWAQLQALKGVTSFAYTSTQLDPAGWLFAWYIQVDARHKDKQASWQLAEQVRQIMVGLPDVPWAEGTVVYSRPIEGPFWFPDDDGSPRYVARYQVRVHPPRAATAGADS